jgi:hypothetical protein
MSTSPGHVDIGKINVRHAEARPHQENHHYALVPRY